MKARFLLPALALLASCGGSGEREAGGVTTAEADALDRAAEMVEDQALPPETIPQPTGTAVAAQPAATQPAAAPSG